jgi:hypothetical protein
VLTLAATVIWFLSALFRKITSAFIGGQSSFVVCEGMCSTPVETNTNWPQMNADQRTEQPLNARMLVAPTEYLSACAPRR